MMRRLILTFFAVWAVVSIGAQPKPKNELKKDVGLSASNCALYTGHHQRRLSKAPHGKHPFYLSHYGRHGSRYMINNRDYDFVVDILEKAERKGKLSPLGHDVLERVRLMYADAEDRLGELTQLGIDQQRDIARRMMERFPRVFEGDAVVDAHSTMVLRCVFSMENALQQMLVLNPKLRIVHEAGRAEMRLMSYVDKHLQQQGAAYGTRKVYDDYCQEHRCWERPTAALFSDTAYFRKMVNGERLNYYLFRMAGSIQNTDLRSKVTLYDLFTDEEIYQNWQMENVFWFLGYGNTPLNGGKQPFSQRFLLRSLIAQADSAIALPRPGVQLRFGHETSLLPLVCLMDINGYGQSVDRLDQLEKKGWVNYRIFPMSANIQLVFYRSSPADKDVLVKVLLNEDEATLPLKAKDAPYYRWADVREFWLKKLDSYQEPE